jgi:hypothetical protein
MPYDYSSLLDLLLRQCGGHANFKRWWSLPSLFLCTDGVGHALEAGDEDAID